MINNKKNFELNNIVLAMKKKCRIKPCLYMFFGYVLAGSLTQVAFAQSETDQALQKAKEEGIEVIMVNANRRKATNLQVTPVSVTALTSNMINELVPGDLGDIASSVPNFIAGKQPGFGAAAFAMRGVGATSVTVYVEPQVGVMVDDFVIPSVQTQAMEMFDVEQIEVLRGPQGTLFGKNTTGGMITVKTKRPVIDETSFDVRGLFGSYGREEVRFATNLGISDTLAFRFAGLYVKSDGYWKNGASYGPLVSFDPQHPSKGTSAQGDGSDLNGEKSLSGRFKLLWKPNEEVEALFQYEIIRDDADTTTVANGSKKDDPALLFNNLGLNTFDGDPLDHGGVTNRDDLFLKMSDGHQVDVDGFYANVDWDIGDYKISSVSGFRQQSSYLPNTYTGEVGPNSLFDAARVDDRETFQQELRIASDFDGDFNFVAGAFYQQEEVQFCVVQVLGFLDLLGLGSANFNDATFFDKNPQVLCNAQDSKSMALFGDFNYEINDQWSLGAGMRITKDEKDWVGRNQVFFQQLNGGFDPSLTWDKFNHPLEAGDFEKYSDGVVRSSKEWTEPTWRATLGYQASDTLYSFFTYARGFKSGGFNDQTGTSGVPITAASAAPTNPEIADSFEIGIKSDLLDRSVRLNLSAFYVIYNDAQRDLVATFDNAFGGTFQETRFFNAAKITASGIEAETVYQISDSLSLRANLGWLNSEYDSFEADTDFDGTPDVNLSDRPVNRAPELQWSTDVTYVQDVFGGFLTWIASVNYEDESIYTYSVLGPEYDGITDSKTLFNANITYRNDDETYYVRIFGKNLTDERYRIGELPVADLWTMSHYGEPRTLGLELGITF